MTANHQIKSPRKLIEVAMPLDAINSASANEKQPFTRRHPRSIHIWWARRPFVAARAVIFAQMVNDPGFQRGDGFTYGMNKRDAAIERKRLFGILEELVLWENTDNQELLERARIEIRRSWREVCELNKKHPDARQLFDPETLPGFHDPFAGGGAIPVEAQRLGLEAYATDLNPVAVLINKALVEVPSTAGGQAPVHPNSQTRRLIIREWEGLDGLAEDIRFYGDWMRVEAERRLGHLYPSIEITQEMASLRSDLIPYVGEQLRVVAYIWARTARSPNPAFSHLQVPLASTFYLSSKKDHEAYVEPIVAGDKYSFRVREGKPDDPAKVNCGTKSGGSHSPHICLYSGTPMPFSYLREEAQAGRFGRRLMAIVVEGRRKKLYLSPTSAQEFIADEAMANWRPDVPITHWPGRTNVVEYGLTNFGDLFTERQLLVLGTLTDLLSDVRRQILEIADETYANAIITYLAISISRWTDLSNTLCSWNTTNQNVRALFARQALPMTWDFVELSPFSSLGSWFSTVESLLNALPSLSASPRSYATQEDAASQSITEGKVVSTDPPYFDNICYAELSDFFYCWLRRSLRNVYPDLFSTVAVPKQEELVANPYRHGTKDAAEAFFMRGIASAFGQIATQAHAAFPITIYYAFKQSETTEGGTTSTGWETFLEGVLSAGLSIQGTWPIRTEREARSIGLGANSLASSIVLVCHRRSKEATTISRREFIRELVQVLPEALDEITCGVGEDQSSVAPVDLSQAIVGPGMAVFSKYAAVLEADGSPMSVRTALQLINRFLAEDDFDADTQFCLHWFEQYGWETGKFGEADTLARAKGTSVDGVKSAGVLHSAGGNVRLLKWAEYPSDWDPKADQRLPIWEVLHQLIRVFNTDGETGAAAVFAAVQSKAEAARQLAYRLYTLCERKGWAEDARAYNEVVTSWSGIESASAKDPTATQRTLFDN